MQISGSSGGMRANSTQSESVPIISKQTLFVCDMKLTLHFINTAAQQQLDKHRDNLARISFGAKSHSVLL